MNRQSSSCCCLQNLKFSSDLVPISEFCFMGFNMMNDFSDVDPIVASFSGGTVGVVSALMVVEINNVKQQEHKRCKYCLGTGYLACARCASTGVIVLIDPVASANGGNQPLSPPTTQRCSNCSGAGKVMSPTCLCTGLWQEI